MGNHHRTCPRAPDFHPGDPPCDRWQRRLKLAWVIAVLLFAAVLFAHPLWKDPAIPGRMWEGVADCFDRYYRDITD